VTNTTTYSKHKPTLSAIDAKDHSVENPEYVLSLTYQERICIKKVEIFAYYRERWKVLYEETQQFLFYNIQKPSVHWPKILNVRQYNIF